MQNMLAELFWPRVAKQVVVVLLLRVVPVLVVVDFMSWSLCWRDCLGTEWCNGVSVGLVVAFVRASFVPPSRFAAAASATASAVPAAAAFQRIACLAACRATPQSVCFPLTPTRHDPFPNEHPQPSNHKATVWEGRGDACAIHDQPTSRRCSSPQPTTHPSLSFPTTTTTLGRIQAWI